LQPDTRFARQLQHRRKHSAIRPTCFVGFFGKIAQKARDHRNIGQRFESIPMYSGVERHVHRRRLRAVGFCTQALAFHFDGQAWLHGRARRAGLPRVKLAEQRARFRVGP
jgi:hypothetical protein